MVYAKTDPIQILNQLLSTTQYPVMLTKKIEVILKTLHIIVFFKVRQELCQSFKWKKVIYTRWQ